MDHRGHRSKQEQRMDNGKILIVDDEQNVIRALARSLSFEEYSIATADNGLDALEFIKENKIDLIISDQRMPQMTGIEFFSKAREVHPDAVRILLTGYADFDVALQAINEAGVHKLVQKPWHDGELKTDIKGAIKRVKKERQVKLDMIDQERAYRMDEDSPSSFYSENIRRRYMSPQLENKLTQRQRKALKKKPSGVY